jgi:hypothetical protein
MPADPLKGPKVRRIVKMVLFRTMGRSDYQRWADPGNLEAWWESRTQKLATIIPPGTRVIEFGAGRRRLELYLDRSCTYIPSDLVDRGAGTVICDLNRRPLPDLSPLRADVAVFAGVLEYVTNVPSLVEWLALHVRYCVASYAVARHAGLVRTLVGGAKRTYSGYMNSYTEGGLRTLFERRRFSCLRTDSWNDQLLFLFEKRQAERRS